VRGGLKPVRSLSALLLVGVTFAGAASTTETSGETRSRLLKLPNPDYVGHVVGQPKVSVSVRVERKRRGGRRVVFEAENEPQVCENEIKKVTGPLGSRGLSRSGHFDALYIEGPADSKVSSGGTATFSIAHGTLGRTRARGFLFSAHHPPDSSISESFNADECWTDGKLRWRAHRVRPGSPRAAAGRETAQAEARRQREPTPSRPPAARRHVHGAADPVRLRNVAGPDDRIEVRARVRLHCDGGDRIEKLPTMVLPVRGGRFERLVYHQDPFSKDRRFTWIRGKIGRGRRASGALAHFDDPWDPTGTSNRAECDTGPVIQWRAQIR